MQQRPPVSSQLALFSPQVGELRPPVTDAIGAPRLLAEAVEAYLQQLVSSSRAVHTVRSTTLDLQGLVEHLGDAVLVDLAPGRLQAHVRWLRMERRNGAASVRRKIASLKSFFRFVVASGWLSESPADALIYPPPQRPPIVALEAAELERVIEASAHDPAWHALVLLLADAGLKRDELLALRAEDLYLAREPGGSRVTVRHAAEAKRVRRRSIELTPRAHFALTRLLRAPLPGGPLFAISVRGVNFVVETVGRRAEIARLAKLTPEILRDTFAVHAMAERISAELAAAGRGASAASLSRLRSQHDAELLQLLGLSRYSDMAARYRAAAKGAATSGAARPRSGSAPANAEAQAGTDATTRE